MDRPGTSVGVMPNVMETGPAGTGGAVRSEVWIGVCEPDTAADGDPGAPDVVAGDGADTWRANCAGRVYKDVPPVCAQRPCTVIVMVAVPLQAAGRSRPDPASTTGVVVGTVAAVPVPEVDGRGDVGDGSALAEPDSGPAEGRSEADEPPEEDGLSPV